MKRYGPSRRRAKNASAALKNSFATPKRLLQQYLPTGDIVLAQMAHFPDQFAVAYSEYP